MKPLLYFLGVILCAAGFVAGGTSCVVLAAPIIVADKADTLLHSFPRKSHSVTRPVKFKSQQHGRSRKAHEEDDAADHE